MPHSLSSCPNTEVLRRLTVGLIPAADAGPLEQHLSSCERCVQTLHGLKASDTLTDALPCGDAVLGRLGGEEVRGLVQRLEAMALAAAEVSAGPEDEELTALAERLPGYRVLRRLGAGGMGVVYQVENLALGRMEALKVMKAHLADNKDARRRFLREAQAMAKVKHEHVVIVYHVVDDPQSPYLTMELLDGETLEDRLQREKRLPAPEVTRIGREIAEGLAAAHDHGLIHRDVKPGNVWLEGERGHVKILDFGLARVADGGAHLTHSGAIVGTPAYMAPEQAGGKVLDARCDLFSLGSVLYRMATGEPAFRGEGMMAVLKAVAEHQPPAPCDLDPNLSALVMRLLEKDPANRPASAREVVERFRDLERRPVVPTKPAAQPGAGGKKRGPRRLWFIAAAAAIVLLALVPVGVLYGPTLVRIVADKGVIVIETDDKDVEVTVKGQSAILIDHQTNREIEITAGDKEIEVTEKPNGLHLFTKKFTLTRGGTEIVRVHEETAKANASNNPAAKPSAEEITNSIGMKFRLIQPGKFLMGSPKDEQGRDDNEGPQHEVEITKPFYMGAYPVTRGQFEAFTKDTNYKTEPERDGVGGEGYNATSQTAEFDPKYSWRDPGFTQGDDHPVIDVTWNDAVRFCKWLSRKEDKVYELPTEAEWEYACRAGTTTRYWCGDRDADLEGAANIADVSLKRAYKNLVTTAWDDGYPFTSPVGKFRPNPWGLYDMHGNVWQWCADGYDKSYYDHSPKQDPKCEGAAMGRVSRGGSYFDPPRLSRAAYRTAFEAFIPFNHLGFRVVMRPDEAPLKGLSDDASAQFTPAEQLDLAWRWFGAGFNDAAERAGTRAIELDPKFADAYIFRSQCRIRQGRNEEAIADADAACRLAPGSAFAFNVRGWAHNNEGELDKALADYNESLRLDPRALASLFMRGGVYARKGDWDHALADLDRFIKEEPLNPAGYSLRAAIYAKKGDLAKAKADWEKAVELNPRLANTPFPTIPDEWEKPPE